MPGDPPASFAEALLADSNCAAQTAIAAIAIAYAKIEWGKRVGATATSNGSAKNAVEYIAL